MNNSEYPLYKHKLHSNLRELVDNRIGNGDEAAFEYKCKGEIVQISAVQFKRDIEALGTFLFEQGIKNTKVALIGENSYKWILSYFAVVNGGNIIVPIDKELSLPDIKQLLAESDAEAIIFSDTYEDVAEDNRHLRPFGMKSFDEYIFRGTTSINNGDNEFIDYEIDNDKTCSIIYTSGTTGKAKGVMLSHKNLVTDVYGEIQNVMVYGNTLLTLPLHHTFAFTTSVLGVFSYGKTISINSSLRTFQQDLKRFKPQNIFVVPLYVETMYKSIWKTAKEENKDKALKMLIFISKCFLKIGVDLRRKLFKTVTNAFGGNLDLIVCGGAPIDEKYIEGFKQLGIVILNGYGITECSPVVAVNRNHAGKKGSVGRILPCCDVKIENDEILVKGDIVMQGYYKNTEATKEALVDGWFKTGDIGCLKDNYLYITGRKKNLIILSNGKNISPEELEKDILNIPNVLEVVVSGTEEYITAEIYAENRSGIQEDINKWNKTLPRYKQISKVIFRDVEFEKTTTKKIKRKYEENKNV